MLNILFLAIMLCESLKVKVNLVKERNSPEQSWSHGELERGVKLTSETYFERKTKKWNPSMQWENRHNLNFVLDPSITPGGQQYTKKRQTLHK